MISEIELAMSEIKLENIHLLCYESETIILIFVKSEVSSLLPAFASFPHFPEAKLNTNQRDPTCMLGTFKRYTFRDFLDV